MKLIITIGLFFVYEFVSDSLLVKKCLKQASSQDFMDVFEPFTTGATTNQTKIFKDPNPRAQKTVNRPLARWKPNNYFCNHFLHTSNPIFSPKRAHNNSTQRVVLVPLLVQKKDIIISEIFVDPSPPIGLPDAEYIEIYNRSDNAIDLAGWTLSDGSTTATFLSQVILPKQYWIVTALSSAEKFSHFPQVIALRNFPTLNNNGDALILKKNQTIDSVNYQLNWYKDQDKQTGGWSLELIDVNNLCAEAENWQASENIKGGTPGKQNSVFANKPDLTGPKLVSVLAQPNKLTLLFNEKMRKPISRSSFTISPPVSVTSFQFNNQLTQLTLQLTTPFIEEQLYTIHLSDIYDCAGNTIQTNFNTMAFALPQKADNADIVINEVLFNPRLGGVDFVEVFNQSKKYINLQNFILANKNDESIKKPQAISTPLIIKPLSFLVFTQDTFVLKTQYPKSHQKEFVQMNLPPLNNDQGSIVLLTSEQQIMDWFNYSADYHSPLLKDPEGVSLERVSIEASTQDRDNWRSATAAEGFATPGYRNSNSRAQTPAIEKSVVIDPTIFSPTKEGQNFCKIRYHFDHLGLVVNAKIMDQQGRVVKTIAQNELIGYDGFFIWNGDEEEGHLARAGYYIAWIEVFDLQGNVLTFRERVILVGGN